jgi:hypothetical protein
MSKSNAKQLKITYTNKAIGVAKQTFDNWKRELDAENEWIDGSFSDTTTGMFVVYA